MILNEKLNRLRTINIKTAFLILLKKTVFYLFYADFVYSYPCTHIQRCRRIDLYK